MSQTPSTPAAPKFVLTDTNEGMGWGGKYIEFRYENDGSPSYVKVPHALAAQIAEALAEYAAKEV